MWLCVLTKSKMISCPLYFICRPGSFADWRLSRCQGLLPPRRYPRRV